VKLPGEQSFQPLELFYWKVFTKERTISGYALSGGMCPSCAFTVLAADQKKTNKKTTPQERKADLSAAGVAELTTVVYSGHIGPFVTVVSCGSRSQGWTFVNSTATVTGITFRNCRSDVGAALSLFSSNVTLAKVRFETNAATTSGGAVYVQDSELFGERLSFEGNTAPKGSALFGQNSSVEIQHSQASQGHPTAEDIYGIFGQFYISSSPSIRFQCEACEKVVEVSSPHDASVQTRLSKRDLIPEEQDCITAQQSIPTRMLNTMAVPLRELTNFECRTLGVSL
jgi:predicted outer membrane repeat protein